MKPIKRFMDWYQGNNDKEKAPPKKGILRILYVVWNYMGKLVMINLLFLISCIPLVTIPASIAALGRYVNKMFRAGYGFFWSDYTEEWKASVFKCMPAGFSVMAVIGYGYYLMSLAGNYAGTGTASVLTGFGAAILALAFLFGCYYFFMASSLDLRNRELLKNSLILLIVEWKADLLLLVTMVAFLNVTLLLLPYSLLFVILCGFSVLQLFVCAILEPLLERRIIKPYEERAAREKSDC